MEQGIVTLEAVLFFLLVAGGGIDCLALLNRDVNLSPGPGAWRPTHNDAILLAFVPSAKRLPYLKHVEVRLDPVDCQVVKSLLFEWKCGRVHQVPQNPLNVRGRQRHQVVLEHCQQRLRKLGEPSLSLDGGRLMQRGQQPGGVVEQLQNNVGYDLGHWQLAQLATWVLFALLGAVLELDGEEPDFHQDCVHLRLLHKVRNVKCD
jgi:hypothetical protein